MKALLRPFAIRLSLLLAFVFATGLTRANVPANDDPVGIKFFTGSWKDVLAEAKKQNKPVFVDIYTTWCGPCKLMAKQAFPDAKVGEKFNANFISYQIDAEKGEGIDVARKYAVTAYPTSLYVSASGELIHRAVGYGGIKGFLDEADKAISAANDPNPLSAMEKQYEGGKRDAEFLRTYLTKRAKLGMPNAEALDAFLTAAPQAEWLSKENIDAVTGNLTTAKSPAFEPLLNEIKSMRLDPSRMKSVQAAMQAVSQAVGRDERQAKTEAELDQAIANSLKLRTALSGKAVSAADQKTAANDSRMNFYLRTKNVPKYREMATAIGNELLAVSPDSLKAKDAASYQKFMDQTKMVPDSMKATENFKRYAEMMKTIETQQVAGKLNSLAWTYFEKMSDAKDIQQALVWSTRMVSLDRKAAFLDTHAQLLGKVGRKAEAVAVEQEALEKAKETGEETGDYEKTLAALKK
ncbi:thioredoxin family protein [Fibrella forsythiae]|uniref:DUF255 domain-containing protein n=1 Tax=Fibrella forsythiae TaxID=2817061 RepID=A0ABS3JQJ0_9BACT|nr:DUF255 domain-containing protein [Fibrella forsythiae]MBO0952271.1 DUF255 domain-containing protein [Fibrella forsythiae]